MSGQFTITAPPSTDIWRKPPSTNSFNAPTRPLLEAPIPLNTFNGARVTFSAPWTTRYDQGGLLLHLTKDGVADRWVKTGIEFYLDQRYLSTVATQSYSDWSITPPTDPSSQNITVEVRREGDELGSSLWVYELVLGKDGSLAARTPLREVCWFFAEQEGWSVQVSAMAARPAQKEDVSGVEGLVVSFEGAQVDVA